MKKSRDQSKNLFIETKLGIVSRTGDWFHTTSGHIEKFVPGLLKKRSLNDLVEEVIAWVRSADGLSMSLLLVLLLFIHPLFAAAIVLAFHFFWYRSKSAFVTIYMGKILKLINSTGFMFITSALIINYLAIGGEYLAMSVGLVFFFLLKLGLLKRLWDKMDASKSNKLSLNDRVFKMILIKYGMHYNAEPAEVKRMEDAFVDLATSRKGGKK
ncbi:MAG TPA: hypothetical protein VFG39_07765 [Balneolaceae bacterium]|nr:hypothetical protein [Balneolaceae bacterium]